MALDRRLLTQRLLRTQHIGALSASETIFLAQRAIGSSLLADPEVGELATALGSEAGGGSGSSGGSFGRQLLRIPNRFGAEP